MRLSVNIDHIATLRQARRGIDPSPVFGALEALRAGADGITFHLREDRRHIQDSDVHEIKKQIKAPLNFEAGLAPDIIEIILDIEPHETTIVPENRQEITTEGGLNVIANKERLLKVIPRLKAKKIQVSLFVEPSEEQILACKEIGADAIELHTGRYSNLKDPKEIQKEFDAIKKMAELAKKMGFVVHAGHGLDYKNVAAIAQIQAIDELNIGHSIISRSVFNGVYESVREMLKIVKG